MEYLQKAIGPFLPRPEDVGAPPITGRLGQVLEGGGKRRIFAIGNYINQRLLKPVHTWLATVLRRLPCDGTFNQHRPLDRLVGSEVCYSFDLKSATDRWPLFFMFEVFGVLFDREFSSSVVNSTLGLYSFDVPFVKRRHSVVSFCCGQPLGYYSSWPLFALTHHLLVWYAAEQVYPGRRFTRYGVLGDDIVIADQSVAEVYADLLDQLGVKISYQKSLISGRRNSPKDFESRGLLRISVLCQSRIDSILITLVVL